RRLRREFPVPLPRPRDRRAVELAFLRGEALTELHQSHVI
ncbi:ABC transporter ATP-binding protein, partial [Pseudomonas sp. Pseusp97]